MVKGTVTFVAKTPSYNSKCSCCGVRLSFYHFELLYSEDNVGRTLVGCCSEECANLILISKGAV